LSATLDVVEIPHLIKLVGIVTAEIDVLTIVGLDSSLQCGEGISL